MIDEPDRAGFAYGTLPGHPESGIEQFTVTRTATGLVRCHLDVVSRPAAWYARLGAPVSRLVQELITRRYLRALSAPPARSSAARLPVHRICSPTTSVGPQLLPAHDVSRCRTTGDAGPRRPSAAQAVIVALRDLGAAGGSRRCGPRPAASQRCSEGPEPAAHHQRGQSPVPPPRFCFTVGMHYEDPQTGLWSFGVKAGSKYLGASRADFVLEVESRLKRFVEQEDISQWHDGYEIRDGFSSFFLRDEGDGFVIEVPDFWQNPEHDRTEDLSDPRHRAPTGGDRRDCRSSAGTTGALSRPRLRPGGLAEGVRRADDPGSLRPFDPG